jgi:hypothetical protein
METNIRNKCKAYTSLEQSMKLAEILPLESADIILTLEGNSELTSYPIMRNYSEFYNYLRIFELEEKYIKRTYIPAWSLAALLNIIPKRIKDFNVLQIGIAEKDFSIWYDEIGYGVNTELPDITMECPVDVAFEMVCWLKENKKI